MSEASVVHKVTVRVGFTAHIMFSIVQIYRM